MTFGAGYFDRSTRYRIVARLSKGVIKFPSEILWSCMGIDESDHLLSTCYCMNRFTDAACKISIKNPPAGINVITYRQFLPQVKRNCAQLF